MSRPAELPVLDDSRCGAVGQIGVREGVPLLLIGALLNTGYNSLLLMCVKSVGTGGNYYVTV